MTDSKATPYFELTICEVKEGQTEPYHRNAEYRTNNINELQIPSLATAHTIASLVGIKHYIVKRINPEESHWGDVVFTTPRVAEIEAEDKLREAKSLEHRYALTEAINKTELTRTSKLNFGITLQLTRSIAEFDPKQSHRIRFDVTAQMVFKNKDGKICTEDPAHYQIHPRIGSGYKLRTKDFSETLCRRGYLDTLSAQEAKDILTNAILRKSAWRLELTQLIPSLEVL